MGLFFGGRGREDENGWHDGEKGNDMHELSASDRLDRMKREAERAYLRDAASGPYTTGAGIPSVAAPDVCEKAGRSAAFSRGQLLGLAYRLEQRAAGYRAVAALIPESGLSRETEEAIDNFITGLR